MDIPPPQISVPDDYIPYPIRTQINQIDPRLDVFWQDYLVDIFKRLRDHDRKNVAVQLLAPKKIFWNKESKTFGYYPDGTEDNLTRVLADIPHSARHLKAFAVSAVRHLDSLRAYEHIEEIADFLENVLDKIQNLENRRHPTTANPQTKALYRLYLCCWTHYPHQKQPVVAQKSPQSQSWYDYHLYQRGVSQIPAIGLLV